MPRAKLTTILTPRVKPTTEYTRPREAMWGLWSADILPWEVTFFPWQYTWGELITEWWTPRKEAFMETEDGIFFVTEDDSSFNFEAWVESNIIKTNWR